MRSIKIRFRQYLKLSRWQAVIAIAACISVRPITAQRLPLDLAEQTEKTDIIVVGAVTSVRQAGTSEVEAGGRAVQAQVIDAHVRVDRTLKGSNVPQQTIVRFTLPISPAGSVGYTGIAAPSYRMLFLRRAGNHFELANNSASSLPATAEGTMTRSSDVLSAVVQELSNVIDSPNTAEGAKLEALFRLGSTSSTTASDILRRELSASNLTIRASAASELLQRNYVPALLVAQELLMHPQADVPTYVLRNLASAIGRGVREERCIPILRVLLNAPDAQTRRAAALALRNTASQQAIPGLVAALGDTDSEVRYYSVIGLGEITNQPDWRPLLEHFLADQNKYLEYWREWARANRVARD